MAILNANYCMHRVMAEYDISYRNRHGMCAHEFIMDAHRFKKSADVSVVDIAKRLMDYGLVWCANAEIPALFFQFSRPDHFLAGGRLSDDGADGIGGQTGAGSIL
jgi:hypothetical protein